MDTGSNRQQQIYDLRPEDELRFESGSASVRVEVRIGVLFVELFVFNV